MKVHGVDDTGLPRRRRHFARRRGGDRQRLIHNHVLAARDGSHGDRVMQARGSRYVHYIDVGIGNEFLVVLIDLGDAEPPGLLAGNLGLVGADRDDIHGAEPAHGFGMMRADEPESHNAASQSA